MVQGEQLPLELQSYLAQCLDAAAAPATHKRTISMMSKLIAIQPPVLPMDSKERFLRAAQEVLSKGGRDGGPRAEGAIDDFKRAVRLWHAKRLTQATEGDLTSPFASAIFDGIRRRAPPPIPKNASILPDAEHGHLAFPIELFRRCVAFADAKIKANPRYPYLGLKRTVLAMVIMFVMTRRFDELQQMERRCLTDLGRGAGFNWQIFHMKNKQRAKTVVPIPDYTSDETISVGARLREFLEVAPFDGRLFRDTRMVPGTNIHTWVPRWGEVNVKDEHGVSRKVTVELALTSNDWNESFQRLLSEAVPGVNAKLYTAHTLRVGGVRAGMVAGLSIEDLAKCCEHRSMDSTKGYMKHSLDERRLKHARIGSAVGQ